jgi:hypothetical protein
MLDMSSLSYAETKAVGWGRFAAQQIYLNYSKWRENLFAGYFGGRSGLLKESAKAFSVLNEIAAEKDPSASMSEDVRNLFDAAFWAEIRSLLRDEQESLKTTKQ